MFIREFLLDMNGTQAAIRAGYSKRSAASIARENLIKPHILGALQEQIKARFERLEINADDLIRRAVTIIKADARELTSYHIGSCRYCHGRDNAYQWKTPREFSQAIEMHMLKGEAYASNHPPPEHEGGYGYRKTAKPNPICPECDGLGEPYAVFADTRNLSPEAALLFEGVKETRDGIQFIMASKQAAFDILAKHYGLMTEKVEHTGKDGKPIQHQLTTRIVIVPAKVPSPITVRPMLGDEAE
jgi:hypothetical protein